jgi:hypothetical protein
MWGYVFSNLVGVFKLGSRLPNSIPIEPVFAWSDFLNAEGQWPRTEVFFVIHCVFLCEAGLQGQSFHGHIQIPLIAKRNK